LISVWLFDLTFDCTRSTLTFFVFFFRHLTVIFKVFSQVVQNSIWVTCHISIRKCWSYSMRVFIFEKLVSLTMVKWKEVNPLKMRPFL